jgi:hypothetical protein
MPRDSTGSGKKTTLFLSLRFPLVLGWFVGILWVRNPGRKRMSRDKGCPPVFYPAKDRGPEIGADECHFAMQFTACLFNFS